MYKKNKTVYKDKNLKKKKQTTGNTLTRGENLQRHGFRYTY